MANDTSYLSVNAKVIVGTVLLLNYMKNNSLRLTVGFTLVELMVVVSIIGILSAAVYAGFGDSRKIARDNVRKTDLKDLQVALALYKAQNGSYPPKGCSAPTAWVGPGTESAPWATECDDYIPGLVPDYITVLPRDPNQEDVDTRGYFYQSNGKDYKVMSYLTVEMNNATGTNNDFVRCADMSSCSGGSNQLKTYAVYSAGAAQW